MVLPDCICTSIACSWSVKPCIAVAGLLLGTATAAFVGMAFAIGLGPPFALGAASLVGAYALAAVHLHARLRRRTSRAGFALDLALARRS